MKRPHVATEVRSGGFRPVGRLVAGILWIGTLAAAQAAAWNDAPRAIVDEPLGARYSLGLTLWHLGHDAERIRQFHAFLDEKGIEPDSLLRRDLPLPATANRILLDPEQLPPDRRGGWTVHGPYLASGAGDAGPTVSLPLSVERGGLYRLWVRYAGWPDGTAVTGLRIYPKGREHCTPIVEDEIYDRPVDAEGDHWKDLLVDLAPGAYVLKLGHVTRWWHVKELPGRFGYKQRRVDCLYLTDEIWRAAPSPALLDGLRAKPVAGGIQRTDRPALDAASRSAWRRWQVRPVSWEDAASHPRLFALGCEFHRGLVGDLARQGYEEASRPDYRDPRRQVLFDDTWNLVANPVRIARQVKALREDVVREDTGHAWHWLDAGNFKTITGGWQNSGGVLVGGYGDFPGTAETDVDVGRAGAWHVWVRFQNIGYHATWHATVTGPSGATIRFDRDKQHYPKDIVGQATWQKIGVANVPDDVAERKLRIEIRRGRYTTPATYRRIYSFFLTTDPDYVPRGTLKPPVTLRQYRERAARLGTTVRDGYLVDPRGWAYDALSPEWWPTSPPPDDAKLVMARNATRAVQLRLRNVREAPVALSVRCGPLAGRAGRVEGKVSWRVVGFVPCGSTRQQWSPFCLLRRPALTVPPLGVAGIWLTVDTHGVPAGEYTADVRLAGEEVPERRVTLAVRVSPVEPSPRNPVIVGGYTGPPEGEAYLRDYTAHRMRMGWYNWFLSRDDMRARDIRLLVFRTRGEAAVRQTVERAKALGLDYDDYCLIIRDEPTGRTPEALKPFLDEAACIRRVDPRVRIAFNPGEAATLKTFEILAPFCDLWIPYHHHRTYHPREAPAKRKIFTAKPWLWYTTPCYGDKGPGMAAGLYGQIRSVPAQPGRCLGFAFFALYYPFRDPWDTAYEHIGDVSVVVLPSRNGPVPTLAWEAVREAVEHADVARLVQERAAPDDEEAGMLVVGGSVPALLEWLEAHGGGAPSSGPPSGGGR